MEKENEVEYKKRALFICCFVILFVVMMLSIYIVYNNDKQDKTQIDETEIALKQENELLTEEVAMLQENVEMLSFEIEELYSAIQCEKSNGNELKDILNLSESEIELLARLVKCEAGGENFECKVNVCVVIFNRMFDNHFKTTLSDVIYEEGQFSPAIKGTIDTAIPTDDCYYAIKIALNLTYNDLKQDYGTDLLFFRAATEEKTFGTNTTYAFTVDNTDFYRLKHD